MKMRIRLYMRGGGGIGEKSTVWIAFLLLISVTGGLVYSVSFLCIKAFKS
jgi:hypothetical protein